MLVEVVIPGFRALFLDLQCSRHISALSFSQDLFKRHELEEEEVSLFMDFSFFFKSRNAFGFLDIWNFSFWVVKDL